MDAYQKLENHFAKITRLNEIQSIVAWDEAVVMPEGGSESRNQAMAELSGIVHELSTSPQIGDWIESCSVEKLNEWQQANLREIKRLYIQRASIPADLNRHLVVAKMECEQKWRVARQANDWKTFAPALQKVLDLTREMLQALGQKLNLAPYDAALDMHSPGLNSKTVEALFSDIRSFLPHMIGHALDRQKNKNIIEPRGHFPMAAQKALAQELMLALGFSKNNGRLDESHHPFCGGTPRDVRITTRYRDHEFFSSLMGVLHETGHALYEQNLPDQWLHQPVGAACGMSIHESQSLFMEMQICRSPEFLAMAAPLIHKHLKPHVENPESLNPENLANLATIVKRGLIRVDADEVTYPAHVILRFEIEKDMINGKLALKELPEVWNEKMEQLLGLSTVGNDKDGCMQDVHWPSGAFGYFPAYTFGAVIAAQLFAQMEKQNPQARHQISQGEFAKIQSWLKENVWSHGSKMTTVELVNRASKPVSAQDFQQHLQRRYLS